MKQLFLLLITLLSFSSANAQLAPAANKVCPLLIGAEIPAITLNDIKGNAVNIQELVKEQPAILVFYRGGWCPYCNRHLSALGELEEEILATGYRIIAISPDTHEELNKTADKNELKYTLLSDGDGSLTKAMGIAFQASERQLERLATYSDGKNKGYLPVPSIFITDREGKISFEYINPDYKKRLSGALLLSVLQSLNKE
ncbi:MAG: peroxiredoxin-like family protein [Flavipsychrobacter sp.]